MEQKKKTKTTMTDKLLESTIVDSKEYIKKVLNRKLQEELSNLDNRQILESSLSDIQNILSALGVDTMNIEYTDEYIVIPFYDIEQATNLSDSLPEDIDTEVLDYTTEEDYSIDMSVPYEVIIYTYNLEVENMEEYDTMTEAKVVRMSASGVKTVKRACPKGQRSTKTGCVRMSASELMARKMAGRKSALARRSMSSAEKSKAGRLAAKARARRANAGL
jgi:hypothetical protein